MVSKISEQTGIFYVELVRKVNELVDKVNELENKIKNGKI